MTLVFPAVALPVLLLLLLLLLLLDRSTNRRIVPRRRDVFVGGALSWRRLLSFLGISGPGPHGSTTPHAPVVSAARLLGKIVYAGGDSIFIQTRARGPPVFSMARLHSVSRPGPARFFPSPFFSSILRVFFNVKFTCVVPIER